MRALLVTLALTGCGAPATHPAAPLVANKVEPLAMATSGAPSDLELLPIDSELVLGINLHQLVGSAVWQQRIGPKLVSALGTKLAEIRTACGYEPLEVMTSVALGMKGLGGDNPDAVAVVRGLPRDKTIACMPVLEQASARSGSQARRDGDALIVTDKDGKNVAFEFLDDTTLLAVTGAAASKATLDAIARRRRGVATSPAFVDMYRKVRTTESAWILMNGNSQALSNLATVGVRPKAVYGSINLTDKLTVAMSMRVATASEAQSFTSMIQAQVGSPQVQQLFDRFDVVADQVDVTIAIELGDAKLQALIGMIGPMLGP